MEITEDDFWRMMGRHHYLTDQEREDIAAEVFKLLEEVTTQEWTALEGWIEDLNWLDW